MEHICFAIFVCLPFNDLCFVYIMLIKTSIVCAPNMVSIGIVFKINSKLIRVFCWSCFHEFRINRRYIDITPICLLCMKMRTCYIVALLKRTIARHDWIINSDARLCARVHKITHYADARKFTPSCSLVSWTTRQWVSRTLSHRITTVLQSFNRARSKFDVRLDAANNHA